MSWRDNAACLDVEDPELFYPAGQEDPRGDEAKAVCAGCPVRAECLDEAMRPGALEYGVWGGLTEQERRARRRQQRATHKAHSKAGPKKHCGKCGQTRPLSDFHRTHVGSERRDSQCRFCKAAAKRGGRPPGDGLPNDGVSKWCPSCEDRKQVAEFSWDGRRADGLKSSCRACLNAASAVRKRRMRARRAALASEERLTG